MRRLLLLLISLSLLLVLGSSLISAQEQTPPPEGGLIVSEVLPAPDSDGIDPQAAITVIFNRPIVPLVISEDAANLPTPITLDPPVEGVGEWLNTSIYVFRPTAAMAGGTRYTITVDDVTAVDGSTLAEPFRWSFTTQLPDVVEVFPRDGELDVLLNRALQVRFNQPVDQDSAEAAFYLRDAVTGDEVSGDFSWADDSAGFRFRPSANLSLETVYEAGLIGETVVSISGGDPMPDDVTWTFETVPLPAINYTQPTNGSSDVYPWGGFTIYFASPMDVDSLEGKITIDPEPPIEYDVYYGDWDNSYTLSFPTEPSTTYTITIAPGMRDIYGNEISEGRVIRYSTAPYEPAINLQAPGSVGFYNAYNAQTQVFLTHLNVSRVDLELYRLPVEQSLNLDTAWIERSLNSYELVRSWSVASVAPENLYRYELLDLGSINNIECPGAPDTRLQVGAMAIVTATDALRARETPPSGEVLTLLYTDYRMPVVGGPACENGLVWWQVKLRDERLAWVAEGTMDEYFIAPTEATPEETPIALADEGEPLPPGLYYLRGSAPEMRSREYQPVEHVLIVGTANITLKTEFDAVTAWVTNVNTGEPLDNAPLVVYNADGDLLAYGLTDADGIARIDLPMAENLYDDWLRVILDDGQDFGIGFSTWGQGIEGWSFGQSTNYYAVPYRAYLYTDRPLYRPDQPVYFRGIVRERDDVSYPPAQFDSLPVSIRDPEGQVIYETTVTLNEFGAFSGQFDLADDAALGYYELIVDLPSGELWLNMGARLSFGVAEYRLPEYQVTAAAEQPEVMQGETIRVAVDSRYFFGGAVSGAYVEYNVIASPFYFEPDQNANYSYIDYDADSGASEFYGGGGGVVTSGEGETDADGRIVIELPASLDDATQSMTFTVEATVTDESGQAVSGRTEVIVHKGAVYVGVRPENYVSSAGEETAFNLIAVDWDGQPVANQTISVEVVERRWSSVQEQDDFGRTTWTYEVEEIPVTSGEVLTGADGEARFVFTPPNGGVFKLKARTLDERGNTSISASTVWVSSREYVSWRQQNSNRIDLIADAESYEVGDTAEILITSPFQGTTQALITVERGGVLNVERVTMDSNSYVYRLPITDEFAPNIYVSAVLVKGVDETNPVAAFRMGLIGLAVSNERKEISIEIAPDVEQPGPGDTVTYTVRTTNYAGDPVSAEVGVGLTDLASLTLADPNSPPILGHFYGQQGLSVRTSTPLTINVDQITQTVLDTIKGGGGGFGEGGIFDIREEFVDTAYWNAHLVTDESGMATFSVTLPDNLTTWRLDARAVSLGGDGNMLVGQDTFDLISTKPLLIRPVTPRFFVVGDQVTLAAIVNNNTPDDLAVTVALSSQTVTSADAEQSLSIPAGQRIRVEWDVTIPDVEAVDFAFAVQDSTGVYTDASLPPLAQDGVLPVYRYEVQETVGTAGVVGAGETRTEQILLPTGFETREAYLDVSLEPSLAATTLDGLTYLQNFPYQCTEQTVSRFLPNIITYRALAAFDLQDNALRAALETNVNFGVQRLLATQKVNGGWGWFVNNDSDGLVTAYALIGLYEAQQQGFPVDDRVIERAQSFLRSTFLTAGRNVDTWRLNRQAFVLYALAHTGDPDIGRTTNLYDSRERLALYANAYLLMALNRINPDDTRVDTLVSDLVNAAAMSATGTHWDGDVDRWNWNTDTRTTAIILQALIQVEPESQLLPNVVRYLVSQRTADAWETTQETAWAVMALTDWMVASGELQPDYAYSATLNGETIHEADVTDPRADFETTIDIAQLLTDTANTLVIDRSDGDGALYYTAHLRAFLPVPEVEPLDNGIIVERRYTMGDSDEPITSARVGDTVQVRLTIIVPNSVHYVVIDDPIPAGTDAVDPNLNTSQQIGTESELNVDDPLAYGWGWWYFSSIEYRDEKVVLSSDYLPAGTYEYVYTIRAGLPGVYNVIPTTAYEFYFPEVYGRGAGTLFTIEAAE